MENGALDGLAVLVCCDCGAEVTLIMVGVVDTGLPVGVAVRRRDDGGGFEVFTSSRVDDGSEELPRRTTIAANPPSTSNEINPIPKM